MAETRKFRIFSMEGAIALFALYALISGAATGEIYSIFWGLMIAAGLVALYFVRKKDWTKHWEEMEEARRQGRR